MRRLLLRQRLYGAKIGFVWAIYPDDLKAFQRLRRPPGRPRKPKVGTSERAASDVRIAGDRKRAGTGRMLRSKRGKAARR